MVTADLIKMEAKVLLVTNQSQHVDNNNWPGHPTIKTMPNNAGVTSVPGGWKNAETSRGKRGKVHNFNLLF